MILGVCGFGFSGSGALLDYLKCYDDIYVADKMEMSLIYKPDGIQDLYNSVVLNPVRYFSSDSAIRRFLRYMHRQEKRYNRITNGEFSILLERYINTIIQVEWKGNTTVHSYQDEGFSYLIRQKLARAIRQRFESRFFPIKRNCWPDKKMYYSYIEEDFFKKETIFFLKSLISSIIDERNASIIAIDQLFPANDPEKYFWYVGDSKAIVVLRDPRDLYLLAKTSLGMSGRFIPSSNAKDFVTYYKGLMKSRREVQSDKVLTIFFEDMIYDTERTVNVIETFLNISGNKNLVKSNFDPKISINNTQLFLKYPEYINDIDYIAVNLKQYLYNFKNYSLKPEFNIKSF